jgi:hypothetical protein
MTSYASHEGISYQLVETPPGQWNWAFAPPSGKKRSGRVVGEQTYAISVVQRAIEVWHLMNPSQKRKAA